MRTFHRWNDALALLNIKTSNKAKATCRVYTIRSYYVDSNGYSKTDLILHGICLKYWSEAKLIIGREIVETLKGIGYIPFGSFRYIDAEETIEVQTMSKTDWAIKITTALLEGLLFNTNNKWTWTNLSDE